MTVRVFFLALILTGCAGISTVAMQDNYMTFEHPFTDAAAVEVRRAAERQCAQRKQAAIKTESACSLTKCFTSYECVDKANAATFAR